MQRQCLLLAVSRIVLPLHSCPQAVLFLAVMPRASTALFVQSAPFVRCLAVEKVKELCAAEDERVVEANKIRISPMSRTNILSHLHHLRQKRPAFSCNL